MPRLPPTTWALRAVMLLGPLLALGLGRAAGSPPSLPVLLAVAVVAGLYALRPDAWFGAVVMVVVVVWWAQAFEDRLPWAVLPATLALTSAHVAGLLADLGPARMGLADDVRRLWLGRALLAVLGSVVLWLVALVVDDTQVPGLWVLALALTAIAAAAVATVLARSHTSP